MFHIRRRLLIAALVLFTAAVPVYSQTTGEYDFRDANKLINDQKWDEALAAFKYLAENNVYNGYYWANYGYASYMKKDYEKAIECFKKQADIGFDKSGAMYNIACCYSLQQNTDEAIHWLDSAAEYKYSDLGQSVKNDKDFDPVRNTEDFKREVMPSADMFPNRLDGWKFDINFFRKMMEKIHYSLFRVMPEDKWNSMINNLLDAVDRLDDSQIITALYKITAEIGDAHTTVFPPSEGKMTMYVLPINLFFFEDGLYITSAAPEYKQLAGKKITKIGNTNADEFLSKLREVTSTDNEFCLKWKGSRILCFTNVLYGLGMISKPDEAEITTDDGIRTTVKGGPFRNNMLHTKIEQKGWAAGRDTSNTPLYLKDLDNLYWFDYIPEYKMVYMQYNATQEKKDEPLNVFVKHVFDYINSNDVDYFTLDIRFNGGGNSFLNKELVQAIVKCDKINKQGNFFTIIGRNTFSAAQNLTGYLERETNVIFAGEPTGSRPDFVGETNLITLPYSGLRVSCSSRYWQNSLSDDYRNWVAPQLGVKYFYDDYKNGTDPAMNEIIKFIGK